MPERNPVPVAPDSSVLGSRLAQLARGQGPVVNQAIAIGLDWRIAEDAAGNLIAVYGPTGTSVVLAAKPT